MRQEEEHHHKSALRLLSSRLASRLGFRWYDMFYLERSLKRALPEFEASLPLECSVASQADEQEILENREPFTHRRLKHRFASEGATGSAQSQSAATTRSDTAWTRI